MTLQWIDADESALNTVSDSCAELARLILSDIPEAQRGSKMQASEEFSNRLRQATGIAKAPYVAEFVRLLLESGEKVVLYGWHRAVYWIWMDKLSEFKPALYTGSESVPQKEEAKRRFLSDETNLIIISLRSGAGLDGLQHACRIVVFGELDWSPGFTTKTSAGFCATARTDRAGLLPSQRYGIGSDRLGSPGDQSSAARSRRP